MAARGHGDAGFSLIELLVAISILGVVLSGLAYGLITAMSVTADSRARTIAANLASQEIDLAGATPIAELAAETVTHQEEVQGIRFTVTRDSQWETAPSEAAACTALANSAVGQGRRFLQVNVTVEWQGRRSGETVRASTAITPAVSSYRDGFGHVAITVVDRAGVPRPGVVVRLEGSFNATEPTTSIGCAFFSDVPPDDDYTVTVELPGYLDADVVSPGVEAPLVVEDGVTTKRDFVFDLAAGLDMTIGGRFGGAVPNGVVVTAEAGTAVTRTSAVGSGTTRRTIGATQADGGVTKDVFPYAGGWRTWAGCAHNRPDAPEYAETGTREVNPVILAPEPGEVAGGSVLAGTLQVRAAAIRPERGGQSLYARDLDAPVGSPCATPLYLGNFGPLGTFAADLALPVGDNWQLVYGTGAGTPLGGGPVVVTPYRAALYSDATSYRETTLVFGPFLYYRLGDALGGTALDSSGAGRHGVYRRGTRIPVAGAVGRAGRFDGSSEAYITPATATLANPSTFSVEIWFRTASGYNRGGRLIGLGNARTGTSSSYDRHLYMRDDGQLVWGVYPGAVQTVATSRTSGGVNAGYNDGLWHHAVATVGPAGMVLYVDGVAAASRTDVTTAENFTGYVRVGGDNLSSWPGRPASYGITADLDEAAAYTGVLSASRVAAHYGARGGAGYADAVLADGPFVYHRFEEPGAVDASGNGRHGSYQGAVAVGRPGALAGDTDAAVGIGAIDQRVNAGDVFDRAGRAPFTLELWVRPSVVDGAYRPLIVKEVATGARNGWGVWHQSTYGVGFERWRDGARDAVVTNAPLVANTWHHVAVTYDGTVGLVYVDGVPAPGNPAMTRELLDTTAPLLAGAWASDYVEFAGNLDEVALYARALSAAEIDAHHRQGRP